MLRLVVKKRLRQQGKNRRTVKKQAATAGCFRFIKKMPQRRDLRVAPRWRMAFLDTLATSKFANFFNDRLNFPVL